MYGRMGIGWTLSGQAIQGRSMNLGDKRMLGGRWEEGDYLEPVVKAHIVKSDDPNATKVDAVLAFGMFQTNGNFLSLLSSNDLRTLNIELFQAFIEAQNVIVPGLTIWTGARQYRGADIHMADYFYFNDLSSQGAGVKYKGLDVAVLLQTAKDTFYGADLNGDDTEDIRRQRTLFVGQYVHDLPFNKSTVHGLAELHLVPELRRGESPGVPGRPSDYGWVLGAKLHLDLEKGNFNDVSVRYGSRIANGAAGGANTFTTFGSPTEDGHYDYGAYGLEVVDHFLWNFGRTLTLNAFGLLTMSKGARDEAPAALPGTPAPAPDSRMNFAVGGRTTLYAHDNFHLINELTFQGRKDEGLDMGTAVKFTIAPTIVPTGERSMWTRPNFRLIYTAGFYNQAAVDQLMSPFLQTVGPTKAVHYLGARTEWWF